MSVDVEGIPSEDKVEANTDDEADSSKKEIGSPADAKSKEVDGKLKVSAGDKNKPTANTELVKQPVDKDEKKLEKKRKIRAMQKYKLHQKMLRRFKSKQEINKGLEIHCILQLLLVI